MKRQKSTLNNDTSRIIDGRNLARMASTKLNYVTLSPPVRCTTILKTSTPRYTMTNTIRQ